MTWWELEQRYQAAYRAEYRFNRDLLSVLSAGLTVDLQDEWYADPFEDPNRLTTEEELVASWPGPVESVPGKG